MMIVQMDKRSAPSSRECVQRLFEKNTELEKKRRRSAQEQIPPDPNAWQQMRENYEAIILEDHSFSEQHGIEYALWQLHYRRIEELRAHYNAALASTGPNASQGVKVVAGSDRVTKIRLQFKTFLSEATGFYHELILKIRAKYRLPLGYFSEESHSRVVVEKDGKKSTDVKKGLISCQRCLIYLGDLARYKGLYGDDDSKTWEYTAASSYYLQAVSLWPSSGNPHHQLAILASYSGDDLVVVYRYFRSLAVDNPFTTARDNLIVAFEKNRHTYSHLLGNFKASATREPIHLSGKEKGKTEAKHTSKDMNLNGSVTKERATSIDEMRKSFCIRFVRLNGILFTRTSLETFSEVLTSVSRGFCELLTAGPEEELNFGADAADNGLFIVRLISILIFTVHNVKREAEGQTYAEIVQRAVLLQNALTAAFQFTGYIFERCVKLDDPSSSFFLPGILVFVEWLACCPDVASGSDADENQAAIRSKFWNHLVSLLNKLLSLCSMSFDHGEDETCFYNLSRYEEGETENRLALWEDVELRGFLPLVPAHTVLDFTRKNSFRSEGSKEKKARVKRILAAGKALTNIVKVDEKIISFDSKMKKFVIGARPQNLDDGMLILDSGLQKTNGMTHEIQPEEALNLGIIQHDSQHVEGEEEDEVIVFQPAVAEKRGDVLGPQPGLYEALKPSQRASVGDLQFYGGSVSAPLDYVRQQAGFDATSQISAFTGTVGPHVLQSIQPKSSKWLLEEAAFLANSLKSVRLMENGHVMDYQLQKDLGMVQPGSLPVSTQQAINVDSSGMFQGHTKEPHAEMLSKFDATLSSGGTNESVALKTSSALPAGFRKGSVSRPVRHLGPPPGFSPVPAKQVSEPVSGSDLTSQNLLLDDYSWLDGYQLPSSTKGSGLNNFASHATTQNVSTNNASVGIVSFPFPGKQVPPVHFQVEKPNGWQNHQALEHMRAQQEQQHQQQLINGNQQFTLMPERYHGESIWSGRYIV